MTVCRVWVAAFCLLVPATFAEARPPEPPPLPADLALVHPDALGFVHVRLGDVWKHETLADLRKLIAKAGPMALAAIDEQYAPKPSTAERITVLALPPDDGKEEPRVLAVLRFREAFDAEAVRKTFAPTGVSKKAGTKEYFADESSRTAVYVADKQTLLVGEPNVLGDYLTWAPKSDGGLTDALRAAAGEKPLFAAVNVNRVPYPPNFMDHVPNELKPLLKARIATLSMDLTKVVTLETKLLFANEAEAADGLKALKKAADMARIELAKQRVEAERMLFGGKENKQAKALDQLPEALAALAALGALNTGDEFLADLPLKQDGATLALAVTLPPWATQYFGVAALGAGLALPAIQKVREAAARSQASNNLKQIGISMHAYHDTNNGFPPAAIVNKKGTKLLSWRIEVLPYLEQDNLYKQFKRDEPWDSDHNKKLIPLMPRVYADPRLAAEQGKTYYKVFVGHDAGFDWVKTRKITEITDGTSNTLMVVAAGEPVIWTKPEDIEFDPTKPVPDLSKPFGYLLCALFDGSVRTIQVNRLKDKDETLKRLIQVNDGNVINIDDK